MRFLLGAAILSMWVYVAYLLYWFYQNEWKEQIIGVFKSKKKGGDKSKDDEEQRQLMGKSKKEGGREL